MVASAQFDSAPAFPGAEGHGRYVTGGRGGVIKHVTNLNDSGTGSFRAAVSGSTAKIIVFDVAGVIALTSELKIGANTTILGQTAPSPGITIRYYTVRPDGNNIIIRYIRFRRGQEKDVDEGADAMWQRNVTGLILDHCSFSWSIDEVASFYDNNNFTMQWCTIGEALNNAGHGKGAHGYGGIWGGKLASFHHNMLIHLNNRVPRFNGARYNWSGYTSNKLYGQYNWQNAVQSENVDFRNCVMYNWGDGNGCYGGPGGGQINIVNNYYKAGPATNNKTRVTQISKGESGNIGDDQTFMNMTSRYYINGNYVTAASSPANYDWQGVLYDQKSYQKDGEYYTPDAGGYYDAAHTTINDVSCVKIKMDAPAPTGNVTTHTAENAYDKVLEYAGASFYRDDVDTRYAREIRNNSPEYTGSISKKKGIIDVVSDVNGYTEATFSTASRSADFDTDNDGIPDKWEDAHGLDKRNKADATAITLDERGYYTNLEVYANQLVQKLTKAERADAASSFKEYYPLEDPADTEEPEKVGGVEYTQKSNGSTSNTPNVGTSYTILGTYIAGGGSVSQKIGTRTDNGIKMRTGNATFSDTSTSLDGTKKFEIDVNDGYTITDIKFIAANNYANTSELTGIYVDGNYSSNLLSSTVTFNSGKESATVAVSNITANSKIEFAVKTTAIGSVTGTQLNFLAEITYKPRVDDIATGIDSMRRVINTNNAYNLNGQRVNLNQKGIIIVNGKKILNY